MMVSKTSEVTDIEVGAADNELRLWVAKEAVRQGERLINIQTSNLSAIEAKATSLMGWLVGAAGLLAACVTLITTTSREAAVLGDLVMMVSAAGFCAGAVWPSNWFPGAQSPEAVLDWAKVSPTELEALEAWALEVQVQYEKNAKRLKKAGNFLSCAFVFSAIGPAFAIAVLLWSCARCRLGFWPAHRLGRWFHWLRRWWRRWLTGHQKLLDTTRYKHDHFWMRTHNDDSGRICETPRREPAGG